METSNLAKTLFTTSIVSVALSFIVLKILGFEIAVIFSISLLTGFVMSGFVGVENIIITKGKNRVAQYNHDGLFSIPSIKVNSKNLVGCGDSFGAAFSFHYSKNRDLNSALDFANLVAGIITTYQTTSELKNLKKDIREYD